MLNCYNVHNLGYDFFDYLALFPKGCDFSISCDFLKKLGLLHRVMTFPKELQVFQLVVTFRKGHDF